MEKKTTFAAVSLTGGQALFLNHGNDFFMKPAIARQ
jgi:hypothetical protein